jgi:hypothetical protein
VLLCAARKPSAITLLLLALLAASFGLKPSTRPSRSKSAEGAMIAAARESHSEVLKALLVKGINITPTLIAKELLY